MPYKDPAKHREYQRQRAAQTRAAYLDGKACVKCGSTEKLQVHHVDPALKISHNIWSWSTARRLAELQKCVVLCEPCHTEHHAEQRRLPCGNEQAYRRGCRCVRCRAAHAARAREQRKARA